MDRVQLSVGAQVADWRARDIAPPSSQTDTPPRPQENPDDESWCCPREFHLHLRVMPGLPQSKSDQCFTVHMDPQRILLKCRFCLSHKLPGDAHDAGPRTTL